MTRLALMLLLAACKDDAAPPPPPPPAPVAHRLSAEREIVGGKRAHATGVAITSKLDAVIAVEVDGIATVDDKPFGRGGGTTTLLLSVATGGNHAVHWVEETGDLADTRVAVDSTDAIVLASKLRGGGVAIAKRGAGGTQVWSHQFGGDAGTVALAVDHTDGIVVGGSYTGALDLGRGKVLAASAPDAGMFVARLSPAGELGYARRMTGGGGPLGNQLTALAIDAGDNAVATGPFVHALDVGGGTQIDDARGSAFFVAFTPTGSLAWSAAYATDASTSPKHIAPDGRGGLVVAGEQFVGDPKAASVDLMTGAIDGGKITMFLVDFGPDHRAAWRLDLGDAGIGGQVTFAVGAGGELDLVRSTRDDLGKVDLFRVSPAGKLGEPTELFLATEAFSNNVAARGAVVAIAQPTGRGVDLYVP